MPVLPAAPVDWMLRPVHRWIWGEADRRVRKLLTFAEVETDGGRDILRAAELTPDPLLRRLYLEHAIDELRHGEDWRRDGCVWRGLVSGEMIVEAGANGEAIESRRTGDRIADLAMLESRLAASDGRGEVG